MTAPVPALLAAALLVGSAFLVAAEPTPGPVAGPAAVVDSPRPTAASPSLVPPVPRVPPPRYSWPLAGPAAGAPTQPPVALPAAPPAVLRRFSVGPFRWSPGHRGVDLVADPGQAVLAAGAGQVAFGGLVAGRPVVVVSHPDGLRTTYEPVLGVVPVGAQVARGDEIGSLARGPTHCDVACLHWGARRGSEYVDPLRLLEQRRPVLLPLQMSAH